MTGRSVAVLLLTGAVLTACGGDTESVDTAPSADRGSERTEATHSDATSVGDERTITTEGGAVVILPPHPTEATTPPEPGCEVRTLRGRGDVVRRFFPPAPGLSARRVSAGEVVVTYQFARFDRRCRPASLELTIDVTDDPLPGTGTTARVRGRRGRVVLTVPRDLSEADVVRGKARTRDGLPGDATAVPIR